MQKKEGKKVCTPWFLSYQEAKNIVFWCYGPFVIDQKILALSLSQTLDLNCFFQKSWPGEDMDGVKTIHWNLLQLIHFSKDDNLLGLLNSGH